MMPCFRNAFQSLLKIDLAWATQMNAHNCVDLQKSNYEHLSIFNESKYHTITEITFSNSLAKVCISALHVAYRDKITQFD